MSLPQTSEKQISGLGALGFSYDEICVILNDKPVGDQAVIERGRLLAEMEFRKSLYSMAKAGSGPAIREYLKFVRSSRKNLRAVDLPIEYQHFSNTEMAVLDGLLMFRGNVSKACKYGGVSTRTFYNWMKNPSEHYTEFSHAVSLAKEMLDDAVEEVIMDKILDEGNVPITMFYARTKLRHRGYSEKLSLGTDDDAVLLPDGRVSPAGRELMESQEKQSKVMKAVSSALMLLEDIEDGEIIDASHLYQEVEEPEEASSEPAVTTPTGTTLRKRAGAKKPGK